MYYLTEDQEILRDTIAEYVDEKLIPRREELDKEGRFPHGFYKDMGVWTPECANLKNPITYTLRKYRRHLRYRQEEKEKKKEKKKTDST